MQELASLSVQKSFSSEPGNIFGGNSASSVAPGPIAGCSIVIVENQILNFSIRLSISGG
jgi:hypothetical protein